MSQKKCTTRKYVRRNRSLVGKRVLVACGFFLLLAGSKLAGSQSNSAAAPATPHPASPAAPAEAKTLPLDGLKLTDDQKTRIAQIRQNVEERREAVIKNEGLSQDRKETILQRLHRTETREIFSVLTPEQQKQVQTRVMEQRSAEQKEHQSKQAAPTPPANAPPTPATR